jgi:superfamily I DNA/RNA helicase
MLAFNPRQQEAVAFPRNTVVNASAGTGKTATLVGAYLSQLGQGIPPGQILAVTFTEKAAAEMRDRLKREVLARVSGMPADGGPAPHLHHPRLLRRAPEREPPGGRGRPAFHRLG